MVDQQNAKLGSPAANKPIDAKPVLRLHHLFTLTAVIAILLGITGPIHNEPSDFARDLRTSMVGFTVLYQLLSAIAITVTVYGIAWHRKRIRFFHQPGHWLFVELAIAAVLGILPWLVLRALKGISPSIEASLPPLLRTVGVGGLIAVINVIIGIKKCDTDRWSWVFYAKAFASFFVAFGDMIVLIVLGLAIAGDSRQRKRDTLHWCGVAVQFAMSLLMIAMIAFFLFAFASGWFAP